MELTEEKVKKAISKLKFEFPYDPAEWVRAPVMENYHKHTDFSNNAVTDSAEGMENYAIYGKKYGAQCLFSGEHGSQGNQFYTYTLAEKYGLKYRHSAEAYWVKDRHEKDRANCHIMLIAKNPEGRKDLNYILSVANEDGYYYQPRVDLELLLSVPPENLIVTSACVASIKYDDIEDCWLKLLNHFGDNFFCELQNHNTEKQKHWNRRVLNFANRYNVQIIAGLDSHFVLKENEMKRLIMIEEKGIQYNDDEVGWYMDYPDTKTVIQRFEEQGVLTEEEILLSVLNTNIFVNGCEDIVLDRHFKIPNIYPELDYEGRVKVLKNMMNEAYKKETFKSKEKAQNIVWEVNQYVESGTVDYPIVSNAIVNTAVNEFGGVLTTTSRGSAASFITSKLLGFTTIDRFNSEIPLYRERFLTKERILSGSAPDIDWNCAAQEPFVEASRKLLGPQGCYPLMALATYKEKDAWKMYSRVNNIEPATANEVSKAIDKFNSDLKYSDDEDKEETIKIEDYIPSEYLKMYEDSKSYQGITKQCLKHPCGHLILSDDIRREIGLISAKSESSGERVLVVACEGKYLDEFGYVKQDFLIVDAVSLTYELFQSIGESVPSFDDLKNRVKDDPATWDIYAKGITCCVNQVEKASTTQKVMKYKPKNIAELSAFIAGIRPGFSSLINTFCNREPYSTGEPKIDELLEDSSHYMLYQESIMKLLSFLGMPMGETYGVIKAISKKKLKGEKKDHLLEQLKEGWMNVFHNLDNFNKVWQVIEDSAAYNFNSSHAYAMAGDSLYAAWFKAHYPAKFYEVAITHYQNKKNPNKNKIQELLDEARKFYGYSMGDYVFGADCRSITIDDEAKIIHPNLSSVKGFGDRIANDLYDVYNNYNGQFKDFIEVRFAFYGTNVTKSFLEKLIKINYFKDYGYPPKLLKTLELIELFYDSKKEKWRDRIAVQKAQKLELDVPLLLKYSKKVTEKTYLQLDTEGYVREYLSTTEDKPAPLSQIVQWQTETLGQLNYKDPTLDDDIYVLTNFEPKNKLAYATLYELKAGREQQVKCWISDIARNPVETGDLIKVSVFDTKQKRRKPTPQEVEETGSTKWIPVPDSYERWLTTYSKVQL